MRRNICTANKKGFSLIELSLVLTILVILAGSITPVFIKRIQIKAGEKTALEISAIEQAALSYYVANNAWPASIQALQNTGYLNPFWVSNNPWQNPYSISFTSTSFTVSTTVPQEWTNLVARDLPTSSIAVNSVSSTVSNPGSTPNQALPVGSIIMWSGTLSSIPADWQLCDGTNGAPDLRDRFVVGASQDSGGVAMTTVSGSITKAGGEARHTLTIAEMPAHSHGYYADQPGVGAGGTGSSGGSAYWETASAGGGKSHNILPPYYAVCFIMKMQ